jgi:hypothetical protein
MQTCGEHLDSVTRIVQSNRDTAEHLSLTLSAPQLEWRPAPYARCVAEWIEYLERCGDAALTGIHAVMLPAWHDPSFEDQAYQRTLMGRCALVSDRLRGNGPDAVSREPRRSQSPRVFAKFLGQQSHLLDVIEEARDIDLRSSPAGGLFDRAFGPCVGDALELLALRQRRGLGCVAKVTETTGFPSRPVHAPPTAVGILRLA